MRVVASTVSHLQALLPKAEPWALFTAAQSLHDLSYFIREINKLFEVGQISEHTRSGEVDQKVRSIQTRLQFCKLDWNRVNVTPSGLFLICDDGSQHLCHFDKSLSTLFTG